MTKKAIVYAVALFAVAQSASAKCNDPNHYVCRLIACGTAPTPIDRSRCRQEVCNTIGATDRGVCDYTAAIHAQVEMENTFNELRRITPRSQWGAYGLLPR